MGPLGLGLLLLAVLTSAASAKPKLAVLGLEVIGSLDPEQVKLARQLTIGLRERASVGTGPYELAPNSDKELVDEKLMNNCGTEALVCMAPIGLGMRADFLMFGNIEKVGRGYHLTIKLIRVATKMPLPTFSEIIPMADVKNDPKGVAKRVYSKLTATDEGSVTIRVANVDRATVYVNDQPKGTTSSGLLTISLPEGKHRLAVVATEKGWQRHEEELALNAGDQRNIPVELARAGQEPRRVTPKAPAAGAGMVAGASGPAADTASAEARYEPAGGKAHSERSTWTTLAMRTSVLAVVAAGGFGVSWWQLSKVGHVPGEDGGALSYSCFSADDRWGCKHGKLLQGLTYGTAIGAGVLATFSVIAFVKGSGGKERAVVGARGARGRQSARSAWSGRALTMAPVVSASGGGAALRFQW
jgi:hypothetical protein